MSNKVVNLEEAVSKVKDGATVMIGGFLAVGSPNRIIDALVEKNVKDLTLIVNDTGFVDRGIGKLIVNKQVKKVFASHIGTNKETQRQMIENELEVILVPQGTLAEQMRAAGYGLGGVLTPTGLGTEVQEGKEVITVDGKDYLLEKPLKADIALIYSNKSDESGNLRYHGSTQNYNNVMATAADYVIVETDELVSVGEIDQDSVHVPHIFIDAIVNGGGEK